MNNCPTYAIMLKDRKALVFEHSGYWEHLQVCGEDCHELIGDIKSAFLNLIEEIVEIRNSEQQLAGAMVYLCIADDMGYIIDSWRSMADKYGCTSWEDSTLEDVLKGITKKGIPLPNNGVPSPDWVIRHLLPYLAPKLNCRQENKYKTKANVSATPKKLDLDSTVKNCVLISDTSSLMEEKSEIFFFKLLMPLLRKHNKKVIFTVQVCDELKKFEDGNFSPEKKVAGRRGAKIIARYQEKSLADLRGDDSNLYTDHLLRLMIEYQIVTSDVCLFTQDQMLIYDVYRGLNSASVLHKHALIVISIDHNGDCFEKTFEEVSNNVSEVECSSCHTMFYEKVAAINKLCKLCRKEQDFKRVKCASCATEFDLKIRTFEQLIARKNPIMCRKCNSVELACSICKTTKYISKGFLQKLHYESKQFVCLDCQKRCRTGKTEKANIDVSFDTIPNITL